MVFLKPILHLYTEFNSQTERQSVCHFRFQIARPAASVYHRITHYLYDYSIFFPISFPFRFLLLFLPSYYCLEQNQYFDLNWNNLPSRLGFRNKLSVRLNSAFRKILKCLWLHNICAYTFGLHSKRISLYANNIFAYRNQCNSYVITVLCTVITVQMYANIT